ncbi:MAG: cytochrome oxidase [Archangium sp.]|nr:cytochrome oxidase [Archangium sp.]
MNVMVLQVFVSLMLVLSSVVLFVFTVKSRTFEHADRLSLTPLEDDDVVSGNASPPAPTTTTTKQSNQESI